MSTRIQPLLAMYDANRTAIENISARRFIEAKVRESIKHTGGAAYVRELRTKELAVVLDQKAAHLLWHNIRRADDEVLQGLATILQTPFCRRTAFDIYPPKDRCIYLKKLPDDLLNRLEPVFTRSDLFDPHRYYEKRFNVWCKSYITQLDQIDRIPNKSSDKYKRQYDAYATVFWDNHSIIKGLLDNMISVTKFSWES